jgi:hypothetical protein
MAGSVVVKKTVPKISCAICVPILLRNFVLFPTDTVGQWQGLMPKMVLNATRS